MASHIPGQVGSEQHYQAYKAEYEMKEKTSQMQADIKEKMVMGIAAQLEGMVDQQMEAQEDEMSDLQALRKKRIQAMQRDVKLKKELLAKGHGEYSEIDDEKAFFTCAKDSNFMVCHFYRDATFRCQIVDKHFKVLAKKYWKCRFVKINAEKCPFLVERLKVFMLPTMTCCVKGQVMDHVVGFDDMGGEDSFPTEALAQRLSVAGVIEYDGGDIEGDRRAAQAEAGKGKGYIGHQRCKGDSDSEDTDEDNW